MTNHLRPAKSISRFSMCTQVWIHVTTSKLLTLSWRGYMAATKPPHNSHKLVTELKFTVQCCPLLQMFSVTLSELPMQGWKYCNWHKLFDILFVTWLSWVTRPTPMSSEQSNCPIVAVPCFVSSRGRVAPKSLPYPELILACKYFEVVNSGLLTIV